MSVRTRTGALFAGAMLGGLFAVPASAAAPSAPPARAGMGMAFDAAHEQVVLFGGRGSDGYFNDTWIWDGTDWSKRTPTNAPSARTAMDMAFDAADGQVVLFGGQNHNNYFGLGDTWTWDGTGWTQRFPVHSPSARYDGSMVYDAAQDQVVLFGGAVRGNDRGDTWIWDGTDWTKRTPVHAPPSRAGAGMAYDDALGQVVLFGGIEYLDDTWTWDGTDWTNRTPVHAPSGRYWPAMAEDSNGQVVLFGGYAFGGVTDETWTWDGTDWARRTPAHAPSAREFMGMTYDSPGGAVVLFGGYAGGMALGDTWTWDGTDWSVPDRASIDLNPSSGPPGTAVQVKGSGFGAAEKVVLTFIDSTDGRSRLGSVTTDETGRFAAEITIPIDATPGQQHVRAKASDSGQHATHAFTVT